MAESDPGVPPHVSDGNGKRVGPPGKTNGDDEQRRLGSAAAGAGMQFVVSILVFVYAGQWLDRKFGTDPLWLLVCLFVGAGGAFYSLYRRLMAAQDPPSSRRPPS